MNREIKFRAWDKVNKKMWNRVETLYDGSIEGDEWDYELKGSSFGELLESNEDNVVLMQYTGLKDKNGKEIYEGDVVKYFDSFRMWLSAKVLWHYGGFGLKIHQEDEGFDIPLNEFWGYDYSDGDIQSIEIIGNIYENPKLLEGK